MYGEKTTSCCIHTIYNHEKGEEKKRNDFNDKSTTSNV